MLTSGEHKMTVSIHNPDQYMAALRTIVAQGRKRIGLLVGAGAAAGMVKPDGTYPLIPAVAGLTDQVLTTLAPTYQQQISVVAARGARAFFPFVHAIDCKLLSGLWVQPCQKLLAGMAIRGSGPNLTAGLHSPQFVPGFPDPDLFDHSAHSGRRTLTPPAPASCRWARCTHHAAAAGTGSL